MKTIMSWFFYIWLLAIDSLEQLFDLGNLSRLAFQQRTKPPPIDRSSMNGSSYTVLNPASLKSKPSANH